MSIYTVLWDPDLESAFIDAWIKSDSRTRALLTDVANWIDANLRIDPQLKGRARWDGIRVMAIPIGGARASVVYEVFPADREVNVMHLNFRTGN
jgi:hypothetical protein